MTVNVSACTALDGLTHRDTATMGVTYLNLSNSRQARILLHLPPNSNRGTWMTLARQIIPGSIYLVTRRCAGRRHMLAPSRDVNALFAYLLAAGCERHGIQLLGAVQMSNHYHAVVYDPLGTLPLFAHGFHGPLARGVNRLRGTDDSVWDGRPPHYLELCDSETVVDMLVYVACNPVAAGLVHTGSDWPGFRTSPRGCAQPGRAIGRPSGFLRAHGGTPASAVLRVCVPPTHRHLDAEEFATMLGQRVEARERELQERARAEGRHFVGRRRLAALDPSSAPIKAARSPNIIPRVAARSAERCRGVLTRVAAFASSYRRAFEAFRQGMTSEIFPGGTWKLAVTFGLGAHAPPGPAWASA